MADPTKYTPGFDYSDFEQSNPTLPKPGAQLDNDFQNIQQSVNQTIDALKDVRRSDGKLKNGIVTPDSLSPGLIIGIETPEAWQTATAYSPPDAVFISSGVNQGIYRAAVQHTSTTFAADLAAGYWELIFNLTAAGLSTVALTGSYGDLLNKPFTVPGGGTTGQILVKTSGASGAYAWQNPPGGGDMLSLVYDPQGIDDDAFDRANHTGEQAIATVTGLQTELDEKLDLAGGTMSGALNMGGNVLFNALGVPDYIRGLITSRSSAYVVSVAAGSMKANGLFVSNAGAFTKTLNVAWVAGSGNGGRLSAAAIAANTTYHLHALRRNSDGAFDWGYDVSATAPTIPAGYSWVGRFWSVYVNSAANAIVSYTQADNFCITTGGLWFSTTVAISLGLYSPPATIPLPSGIKTRVRVAGEANCLASGNVDLQLYHAATVTTALADLRAFSGIGGVAANTSGVVAGSVITDTSRNIGILLGFSGAGGTGILTLVGWEDFTLNRVY